MAAFAATLLAIALAVFLTSRCDMLLFLLSAKEDLLTKMGVAAGPSPFQNQVILVTGASSGIGRSLAENLHRAGAKVIAVARRRDMLEELAAAFGGIETYAFDITNFEEQERVFADIMAIHGRIDQVVLNAGRSQRLLAVDTVVSLTKELFDLNFFSYLNLVQKHVLPQMIKQGGGSLLVLSSISGKIGTPIASSYSATKFALHGYFDALRSEVSALHGITVQLVCPGPVATEIAEKTIRDDKYPVAKEGEKMGVEECCKYILVGMRHRHLVQEMWISSQPILLITYVATNLPYMARLLFDRVVGPSRVRALAGGEDIYDVKKMFGLAGRGAA